MLVQRKINPLSGAAEGDSLLVESYLESMTAGRMKPKVGKWRGGLCLQRTPEPLQRVLKFVKSGRLKIAFALFFVVAN